MIREPVRAGSFYPAAARDCETMIKTCLDAWEPVPDFFPKVGIVPHAGWVFSGPTAAAVYKAFLNRKPDTFIILGAVHVHGVSGPVLYPDGAWRTPLGEMEIDADLNRLILEKLPVAMDTAAHEYEHSIEVQIPFLQYLFPESRLMAVALPPLDHVHEFGTALAEILKKEEKDIAVLASTDMTHYGAMNFGFAPKGSGQAALDWVKNENDKRLIDLILNLEASEIVQEAENSRSACGAGAIAAAVAFAKATGLKEGRLLDYTTSYDVMPDGPPSDFVGYAGIVF